MKLLDLRADHYFGPVRLLGPHGQRQRITPPVLPWSPLQKIIPSPLPDPTKQLCSGKTLQQDCTGRTPDSFV
jgi:hypothetical protein